jgi:hypothetical protein
MPDVIPNLAHGISGIESAKYGSKHERFDVQIPGFDIGDF